MVLGLMTITLFPQYVRAQAAPFGNFETDFGILRCGTGPGGESQGCSIDTWAKGAGLVGFIDLAIKLVTAVVVAVGLITFVVAGYVYMTAGGSAQRIGTAKTLMGAALLGIILAITAQLILNTISPQFASQVQEPVLKTPAPSGAPGAVGL